MGVVQDSPRWRLSENQVEGALMHSRLSGTASANVLGIALVCTLFAGPSGAESLEGAERITLEGPAVLASPEGESVQLAAGDYGVRTSGESDLSLTPVAGDDPLLLGAEAGRHDQMLEHPVALSLAGEAEDAGTRHIVLMLPGGELREAIGSDGDVATRGALQITSAGALGKPMRRKLQRLRPKLKLPAGPKSKTPAHVKPQSNGTTESQSETEPTEPVDSLPAATHIESGARYRLTNDFLGDEMSLDVAEDGSGELYMGDTGPYPSQYWTITAVESYYKLTTDLLGSGKSLDVVNDGSGRLIMADTGHYTGQLWKFTRDEEDDTFRLTTEFLGEGKSLDVIEDDEDEWRELILAESVELNGQYWKLTKLSSGHP